MDNATSQETVIHLETYLPHFFTFGSTVTSVLLAGWLALKQQRKNAKEALKADIYEKIADKLDIASSALITSNTAHTKASIQLSLFWENCHTPHNPYTTISHNRLDLIDLHYKAAQAVTEILLLLERYAITGKNFEIFAQMLGSHSRKYEEVSSKYQHAATPLIPIGASNEDALTELHRIARLRTPTRQDIDNLQNAAKKYSSLSIEMTSYLSDISISAQKHFLGTIFPDNKLEYRVPLDPDVLVLRDDPQTLRKLQGILEEQRNEIAQDYYAHNPPKPEEE
ncbi:hypothetical protein [Salidesulfovibrio brasiliensis]|uniref:hypothetical protein n=1 Tax=Salidesulfovibrio brasiliensis TaxID=221711 RepID=UPI000AD1CC28|nr:hypothetical protein [Salidesulfovibrio brasiliensis]